MPLPVAREAGPENGVPGYQRHRPERILLYQLVAHYYPAFADLMTAQGWSLPDHVQREFEDYLKCRRLEQWMLSIPYALRFLFATRPAVMGRVPGIVYRTLATHQTRMAGHTQQSACTGAVTFIQRFGSALDLDMPQGTFS
jgi:hypothetical protein